MNILLFGARGMVGDGVLGWLIGSPQVSRVFAVSRKPLSAQHSEAANRHRKRHVPFAKTGLRSRASTAVSSAWAQVRSG
jgi:hypothetical protein